MSDRLLLDARAKQSCRTQKLVRPALSIFVWLSLAIASEVSLAQQNVPDIKISELRPGVYRHESFMLVEPWGLVGSNGLVAIDGDEAFIINTPWSEEDTQELVAWIRSQGLSVAGSISSHSHSDGSAGIGWLNSIDVPTYALDKTNEILAQNGEPQAVHSFAPPSTMLADGLLEVFYPGPGHTIDNVVVWLPKSNVLYGGCFVRSLGSRQLGYLGEAYVNLWNTSMEATLARYGHAEIVVPGHGAPGDTRLLDHTRNLSLSAINK